MMSAVNRPTDTKVKEKVEMHPRTSFRLRILTLLQDINQKLQLYGIFNGRITSSFFPSVDVTHLAATCRSTAYR